MSNVIYYFTQLLAATQGCDEPAKCIECHADEFAEFLTDGLCDNCFELTNQQG